MNSIFWTAKASKQLSKIGDKATRQRIYIEAQALASFPQCAGVKKLTNAAHGYRLRVGDWRVMFDFDGSVQIVSIEDVRKRNERTY